MEAIDLAERLIVLLESDDLHPESAHEENTLYVRVETGEMFVVTVAKVSE